MLHTFQDWQSEVIGLGKLEISIQGAASLMVTAKSL